MGRPSKLTDKQWAEIQQRLLAGEKSRPLGRADGRYTWGRTADMWTAWQARAALAMPGENAVTAIHIGFDYLDNGQLVATYAVPVADQNSPQLYIASQPPTLPDEAQSRAEFETYTAFLTDRNPEKGYYLDAQTRNAWLHWQASRAALKGTK